MSRSQKAAESARKADGVNVISKNNAAAVAEAESVLKDPAMVPSGTDIVERDGATYHEHTVGGMTVSTRVL